MSDQNNFLNDSFVKAAQNGDVETIKKALNEGVSPNATNNQGCPALIMAAAAGKIQAVKLLLAHKANVHLPDRNGFTALHYAADGNTARVLIDAHADLNACNNLYKSTPLNFAALNGKIEVVQTLLDYNVSVNQPDIHGNTALIFAAYNTDRKTVQMLLKKQAQTEIRNESGQTALMLASIFERNSIIDELVQNGAHLNAQDNEGNTPLMLAAYEAEKEGTIRHLLDLGARIDLQNKKGQKAIDMYQRNSVKDNQSDHKDLYKRLTVPQSSPIARNIIQKQQTNQRTR